MRNLILIAVILISKVSFVQTWEFNSVNVYTIDSVDCHYVLVPFLGDNEYKNKITLKDSVFNFNKWIASKVLFVEKRKDGMYYYCRDIEPDPTNERWEGFIVVRDKTISVLNWNSHDYGYPIDSVYLCYNK